MAHGWQLGAWLNEPVAVEESDAGLLVECAAGSDFWRTTHYGFRRDSGHALLRPFERGRALEVTFDVTYDQLYDQAGLMIRADERTWLKAGVEISDGLPQVGAVVTHDRSDWSCAPVPSWAGRRVTLRVSWARDALAVRARVEREPWRLVRLAWFDPPGPVSAGLYCASPERAGLRVLFTGVRRGPADTGLHLA